MQECKAYRSGSAFDTYLAIALAIGIIMSYVPQQVMILRRRTIEGISPAFLFLMNAGAALILGNMVLEAAPIFKCCPYLGVWQCLDSLLGFIQIAAAFLGPMTILLLSVQYTGYEMSEFSEMHSILRTTFVIDAVVALAAAVSFGRSWSRPVANTFGILGAGLGVVQYLPQLMTTHRLKHTGSLSKLTLLIQIPGGYLWCLSLYLREGSVWSTWITIFVSASLQLVLLLMAVYYSIINTQHVVAVISKPVCPSRASLPDQEAEDQGNYHDQ